MKKLTEKNAIIHFLAGKGVSPLPMVSLMKTPTIKPFLNEWIVILHNFHQLPHSESLETVGVDTHAIFTKLIADDWCGPVSNL